MNHKAANGGLPDLRSGAVVVILDQRKLIFVRRDDAAAISRIDIA
jgi:hypothetical protein